MTFQNSPLLPPSSLTLQPDAERRIITIEKYHAVASPKERERVQEGQQ